MQQPLTFGNAAGPGVLASYDEANAAQTHACKRRTILALHDLFVFRALICCALLNFAHAVLAFIQRSEDLRADALPFVLEMLRAYTSLDANTHVEGLAHCIQQRQLPKASNFIVPMEVEFGTRGQEQS